MALFQDATAAAQALADLETEYGIPADNPLHKALDRVLVRNFGEASLTAADVSVIRAIGPASRGGTPKPGDPE